MSISSIQLPQEKFSQPQVVENPDVVAPSLEDLLMSAIDSPVDYPPLREVVFDGDRIALALLAGLEHPEQVVDAILTVLARLERRVEVDVVAGPAVLIDVERLQAERLTRPSPLTLHFHRHDATAHAGVAYLAACEAGRAIDVNRVLFDADIVIPVGSAPGSIGFTGLPTVYPEFSSAETVGRFQSQQDSLRNRRDEIARADQNIGADLAILTVSGPGGLIRDVKLGHRTAIAQQAVEESNAHWQIDRQLDGQVVLVTIETSLSDQAWEDFFRALTVATAATDNVRQIVVCSVIDQPPSAEYRRVFDLQFESDPDVIRDAGLFDSRLLENALSVLMEQQVFLKSRLEASVVEDLGLGCIETDEQLQRIIDRADSGVFLRDAHRCTIRQD